MKQPKPKPADAAPAGGDATSGAVPHADTTHAGGGAGPLRLEPGAVPVPDYQLVAFLGRGGYGEVWKAHGPGGYAVALKFIPLGETSGAAAEERSAELLKAKDIRHPNLLGLFGSWRRHGLLILAMELADRALMDRFNEARRQGLPGVPFPELREHMREAAKGLDHLHSVGVQHRDVKPQNLLLVGGGVKVADFGLAKVLEHTTASNTGSMTPAYAAPEFLKGRVSPNSDQYSLAVAYCQLRGGKLPFNGGPAQVMMGHLYETPDLTALPAPEQPTVAKALAKDPNDRYPSCRQFVEVLVAAATAADTARTAPQPQPAVPPKPAPPVRKRPPSAAPTPAQQTGRTPPSPVRKRSASAGSGPHRSAARRGPRPVEALPWWSRRPWLALTLVGGLLLAGVAAVGALIWMGGKPAAADNTPPVVHADPPPVKTSGPTDAPKKPGNAPPLRLSPIAPVTLAQGQSAIVKVAVQRDDHSQPIEFRLEGLPAGVEASRVPAGPDVDAAAFELNAAADAAPAETWATAAARAGDAHGDAAFHLKVLPSATGIKPDGGAAAAVRAAIKAGREHLDHNEWGLARSSFSVAIELDPQSAEAYAYRAKANDNSHRYDDALADADKAVELDPNSALAHAYRCDTCADKGDLDKAMEEGDRAVDLDPKSAVAHRSRGYACSMKGDKDAALRDFDEAIRLDPAYADPYSDRGAARLADGQDGDALKDFDQVVALAPKSSNGYIGRSTVHIKQEKWDLALDDLNQAVQAAPKDADALIARGEFHHSRGDVDQAVADFRAAIRLSPKLPDPHISLAEIYTEKGDNDRAIEEYSEVIELDGKNAFAFNGRAWRSYAKADYDAALNDFSAAIELDGKNTSDYDGRGWCHYRKGDFDAAVEDFGKALDLDSKNADALAGRGWTYHAQGQNDMALDDLNASIEINPKDANNFNERGNVYFNKEDYAKAIDDFTEAINLSPSDAQLYLNRASAYDKTGDADKAEADRKKAEEIKSVPK